MWTRLLLAAASLALISAGCASSEAKPHRVQLPPRATNVVAPWITTQNGRFVDARSGSAVVLRGVNVAVHSSAIVYDKAAELRPDLGAREHGRAHGAHRFEAPLGRGLPPAARRRRERRPEGGRERP